MDRASEIAKELFWRNFYYEYALELFYEGDIEGAVISAKRGARYADDLHLLKSVNFGELLEYAEADLHEESAPPNIYLKAISVEEYAANN